MLTQDALAAMARMDRNFLGRIERGNQNLTLATLARLAHALSLTVADLVADVRVDEKILAELDSGSRKRNALS